MPELDDQIDDLSEGRLNDYFSDLPESYPWITDLLDLYGLKFYPCAVSALGAPGSDQAAEVSAAAG